MTANQAFIVNTFADTLAQWFIVHKDTHIHDNMVARLTDTGRTGNIIWIEIGHNSPWSTDDRRLKDGMTQDSIDRLRGWDFPLKQRLAIVAGHLNAIPRRRPSRLDISTEPRYRAVMVEVFIALKDASNTAGLDTAELEKAVRDASLYENQQIDRIRDGLLDLSKKLP